MSMFASSTLVIELSTWITLNEPNMFSISAYLEGTFAPGRCSKWIHNNCRYGNSSIEPCIVGHHQILAHADAVEVYRTKYQVCDFQNYSNMHLYEEFFHIF